MMRIPSTFIFDLCMPLPRALLWVSMAAGVVGVIAGLTVAFEAFGWDWVVYAVVVGILLGLLVGLVVLTRLSTKLQLGIVGAVTGMGLDLLATGAKGGHPKTALNSIATLIANTVSAAQRAATGTGLPTPAERPVAVGLWVFAACSGS